MPVERYPSLIVLQKNEAPGVILRPHQYFGGRLVIRVFVERRIDGALEPVLAVAVEEVTLDGSVALLSGNDDVGVTVLTGDFVDVADCA